MERLRAGEHFVDVQKQDQLRLGLSDRADGQRLDERDHLALAGRIVLPDSQSVQIVVKMIGIEPAAFHIVRIQTLELIHDIKKASGIHADGRGDDLIRGGEIQKSIQQVIGHRAVCGKLVHHIGAVIQIGVADIQLHSGVERQAVAALLDIAEIGLQIAAQRRQEHLVGKAAFPHGLRLDLETVHQAAAQRQQEDRDIGNQEKMVDAVVFLLAFPGLYHELPPCVFAGQRRNSQSRAVWICRSQKVQLCPAPSSCAAVRSHPAARAASAKRRCAGKKQSAVPQLT